MLFNRENNGSEELHNLTGSFDINAPWSSVEGDVDDAVRTVGGLVGMSVMKAADELYLQGTEDGLVAVVRLSVAVLAVMRWSRGHLLSHEETGSKFKADPNEKMPWEWMVDRDERAQQDRWYRSLDALYAYLEQEKPKEWTESDAYKRFRRSIVRNLDELEAIYPADGSYYVFYLLQGLILECQGTLHKVVGDEKWALITATSVADSNMDLLRACQRWAVLTALVRAVRRWSLEVFPLSIVRRFCPSYQGGRSRSAATREEMDAYVAGLEGQIAEARADIAEILAGGENPWRGYDPQPRNDPSNKFFTAQ